MKKVVRTCWERRLEARLEKALYLCSGLTGGQKGRVWGKTCHPHSHAGLRLTSISFTFEGVQGHHTDSTVIQGAGSTALGPTTATDLPGACVLSWSLSCPFTEDHSSFSILRFCHNRGQHLARSIRAFKRTVKLRSLHLGNSFQILR